MISPVPVTTADWQFQQLPVPETVHVPVPRPIVAEEVDTTAVVTENVFALKVAEATVMPVVVPVVVNASARLTVPEGFWQAIVKNDCPAEVMVCVPIPWKYVKLPRDCVTPVPQVQSPYTATDPLPDKVMAMVRADILRVPMFHG